ncbi:unnamed protein product [Orchesella dallaii]
MSVAKEVIDDLLNRLAPEDHFIRQTVTVDEQSSDDTFSDNSSDTEISLSESVKGKDETDLGCSVVPAVLGENEVCTNEENSQEEYFSEETQRPDHDGDDDDEKGFRPATLFTGDLKGLLDQNADVRCIEPVQQEKQQESLRISSVFYEEQVEKVEKELGTPHTNSSPEKRSTFDLYLSTLEKALEELNKVEAEKMNKVAARMEEMKERLNSFESEEEQEQETDEEESDDDDDDNNGSSSEDEYVTASSLSHNDSIDKSEENESNPFDGDGNYDSAQQCENCEHYGDRLIPPEMEEDIKRILSHDLSVIEAVNMERVMDSLQREENPDSLVVNKLEGFI